MASSCPPLLIESVETPLGALDIVQQANVVRAIEFP